jgi:hypothetical protein
MPVLTLRRTLFAVLASGLFLTTLASGTTATSPAIPTAVRSANFTGYWWGHTRGLTITDDGRAIESIFSGCCLRVINLHLQVSPPRGTRHNAIAVTKATAVWVPHPIGFSKTHPPPVAGQTGSLRLRDGVITDSLTGATYCAPTVDTCGL